ncbi:hypothetical protein HMPREF3213_00316 [Heyndrickxia coagulans]|uniref:Uncharacterized protein n=1 Tax=Heyndrickxia coagulans TaxID=1398 RepID=A0A133L1F5_HEYCO|nr:hypothetical protein HMPREF3213_00316 [Heyndrickxia coagulans]
MFIRINSTAKKMENQPESFWIILQNGGRHRNDGNDESRVVAKVKKCPNLW